MEVLRAWRILVWNSIFPFCELFFGLEIFGWFVGDY